MDKSIRIGNVNIGAGSPPFIVAEMSGNHNQSLKRALDIVDAAADAGAHALKIQTYTADTMTIDIKQEEFVINDPKSLWNGRSLYDLYKEAATPWDWHEEIFDRCKQHGILGFSTPFDETSVDFLEDLGVPCYKIASFEIVDIPLIKKVASTGKPLFMSTGMATIDEINEAVAAAKEAGGDEIVLLKCTSSYPASPENSNIITINDMKQRFGCLVGISDHTIGTGVSVASVAIGAAMIEKHFTISRKDGGVDAAFSMEPEDLKNLVKDSLSAWQSIGKISYGPTMEEKGSMRFRRSIYIVKEMKAGDIFTKNNVRSIRPAFGLPPKFYDDLIGKKIKKDAKMGTPVINEIVDWKGSK